MYKILGYSFLALSVIEVLALSFVHTSSGFLSPLPTIGRVIVELTLGVIFTVAGRGAVRPKVKFDSPSEDWLSRVMDNDYAIRLKGRIGPAGVETVVAALKEEHSESSLRSMPRNVLADLIEDAIARAFSEKS